VAACVTGGSVLAQKEAAPAAPAAPAGGAYKIGVVDMQRLIVDYPKRQDAYKKLQAQVDEQQKGIDTMSTNIDAAKKKYEESKATMTEQQKTDAKNKIESDFAAYRIELDKRQRMIDNQEETVMKEIMADIEQAIAQIAQAENYHLVLSNAGPVLYATPTIDITAKVQAKLK